MPANRRPDPHVAWPLKVLAVAAVGGALLAGYRSATGGDDDTSTGGTEGAEPAARSVVRTASTEIDASTDIDEGAGDGTFEAFPPSYRITYRVRFVDTETAEVVEVVAPFDSRTTSYRGTRAEGAPIEERELTFGVMASRSGGQDTVLEVPPTVSGPRPAAVLAEAEELGLVERRERRKVAGRTCQVWRTSGALDASTFVPPTDDDYFDLCVDGDGLVLEEWQVVDGSAIRQRVAVTVETGAVDLATIGRLPREATLEIDQGGGSLEAIPLDQRPVGPFLELGQLPSGFTRQGRYTVVPPQAALVDESQRGRAFSSTTDVLVRGVDVISVERGGVLDLSDPWTATDAFPDVDLGPAVGTGELLPGRTGGEVRALLGSGRFLRITGTVDLATLVEVARSLVPVEDGTGLGFGD